VTLDDCPGLVVSGCARRVLAGRHLVRCLHDRQCELHGVQKPLAL